MWKNNLSNKHTIVQTYRYLRGHKKHGTHILLCTPF